MGYAIAGNMDTISIIKAYEMALRNRKTNKHQLNYRTDRVCSIAAKSM